MEFSYSKGHSLGNDWAFELRGVYLVKDFWKTASFLTIYRFAQPPTTRVLIHTTEVVIGKLKPTWRKVLTRSNPLV